MRRRLPVLASFLTLVVLLFAAMPAARAQSFDGTNCNLASPAFCDTFDNPSPVVSRTGQIDPTKWTVAHNGSVNPNQSLWDRWAATDAMHCKTPISGVLPPNDYFMCGVESGESEHFMEAMNDDGNYQWNDARILQPFDFAGRTGRIDFDVDAKTAGSHSWWVEVAITDLPIPGAHTDQQFDVQNGVILYFQDTCGVHSPAGTDGAGVVGVNRIDVTHNYVTDVRSAGFTMTENGCTATMPDMKNHFEIRMTDQHLELWGTDHMMQNFRMLASTDNMNLGFTRGYVHFEHTGYSADKAGPGVSRMQTYHWDNIGFDGPVVPAPAKFQVDDSNGIWPGNAYENLGYKFGANGLDHPMSIQNVDLTNATGATLAYSANLDNGIRFRLNSGPWHQHNTHHAGGWDADAQNVPLSELHNGSNTLEFQGTGDINAHIVANIDLLIDRNGPGQPTSTPVPTNTPAPPTSTPLPTNTPMPTSTPLPTNTPAPTSTPGSQFSQNLSPGDSVQVTCSGGTLAIVAQSQTSDVLACRP